MNRRGFALVELVIVVVVAGILAAVTIPYLVRSRIAANESATVGDIRTVISAQAAYKSVNAGFYDGNLTCLVDPDLGCIPSYPSSAPTFLDSLLGAQLAKAGYNRSFQRGPSVGSLPPNASPTSVLVFRYDATATLVGITGVRGFAGDNTGRLCFTRDGPSVGAGATAGTLDPNCQDLR